MNTAQLRLYNSRLVPFNLIFVYNSLAKIKVLI